MHINHGGENFQLQVLVFNNLIMCMLTFHLDRKNRFEDDQNNQFKLEFVTFKNDHNIIMHGLLKICPK